MPTQQLQNTTCCPQMMLRVKQGPHSTLKRGLPVTPLRYWKKGRFEDGEARALAQLAAAQEDHQRCSYTGIEEEDADTEEVSLNVVSRSLMQCPCSPFC